MKTEPELWEVVKAIVEDHKSIEYEYGNAKATMLANFGKHAHSNSPYKGIIEDTDTLNQMITKAFEYMHSKIKQK